MATEHQPEDGRIDRTDDVPARSHDLTVITEWLPGTEPTNYDIDLAETGEYRTRYWRCRNCGQERTHPEEFRERCPMPDRPDPVTDGGYSLEEPRTRRALSEDMTIHYGERGPRYIVDSESGRTYEVVIDTGSCTCPDHQQRNVRCKHLRRVDLAIRARTIPGPDGTFSP